MVIAMMRRNRRMKDPSEILGESRIAARPAPKSPGVVDLAKSGDERTLNYLRRAKKRKL